MTYRLIGALGALMIGMPVVGYAADGNWTGNPNRGDGIVVADKGADAPASRDDLFDLGAEPAKETVQKSPKEKARPAPSDSALPSSKTDLFADEPSTKLAMKVEGDTHDAPPLRGFFQAEVARTYVDPEHWSKVLGRLELGTQGRFGQDVKWKLSGRVDYNAVYDLTDYYQEQVRDDQRADFQFRETYMDFSAGGWDWRVGRQQVVWGEMVGLFFADVVSAKDMREFILPDFQVLRIPQWAARAEYFKGDFHAEVVWIPFPSYDEIGKPFEPGKPGAGSDFFPYPVSPAGLPIVRGEEKPSNGLDHTNFGVRISQLTNGWDLSGFLYTSMDSAPTFYRDPVLKNVFTPRHDRIWQAGGTLAKDLGDFVVKGEAVYTDGRSYNVTNLTDSDGLVQQNTLDWVVGLDFNPTTETRLNVQFFERVYFDHQPDTLFDSVENGVSMLVNHKLAHNWEAEALLIRSLNRDDWLLRPKLSWRFRPDWRLNMGVDVFSGPPTGLFGQFDAQDRVYTELRHDF